MTPSPPTDAASERKVIVCIEDDPDTLQLIRLALRDLPYNFVGITNPAEGLEMLKRKPPHLVLLDIMMPDMNGWEVYRRMRMEESLKGVPVIVITARASHVDRVYGEQIAKVNEYLNKPFEPSALRSAIRRLLDQRPG